jgi:hypothetical protein
MHVDHDAYKCLRLWQTERQDATLSFEPGRTTTHVDGKHAILNLALKRNDLSTFLATHFAQDKHLLLVHAMGVAPTAHHPPCSDDVSGRVLEDSRHRLT